MKRVAALVPSLLGVSPGQRVRIESWAKYLQQSGWAIDFYPFEDASLHQVLYRRGAWHIKAAKLASCYLQQLRLVLKGPPCDILFIFREASLVGPAIMERLAKRLRVPIIYDLDDPVFIPYRSPMNGWFSLLKFSKKTHAIFRLSDHVITINDLIANYARKFNPSVSVIPNCVDVEHYSPIKKPPNDKVRLVWMGSHSTMSNLISIADPLQRLQADHNIEVRVIGSGRITVPGVDLDHRLWSAKTEISDLQDCDIGLVPLPNNSWHPWKFFFKSVQYMAVGMPVVARQIGSNSEIIEDGVNGFLVETQEQWHDRLQMLIKDKYLRQRMGRAARATVLDRYSTQTQMPRLVSTFEQVLERHEKRRDRASDYAA